MKFYEIFIKLCDEHKIAATNVVKTLKISTSKPTNWKNGATPSVEHLLEIANYFNVSTDYLLGLTDNKINVVNNNLEPDYSNLINQYSALNEAGQQRAKEYIKMLSNDEQFTRKEPVKKVSSAS